MSILAQQLSKLKQTNVALSIAPGASRPTLILDKNTARNTTTDVLYTMAVMGYSEIKKHIFHSGRQLGEELLSQNNRDMNRNKLTKEENRSLSIKITRFLLIISPTFMNKGCQAVIEYFLRNYSIHVFEAQQTALIFLQYWQQQQYHKLISTLQLKSPSFQFLKIFQSQSQSQKQKQASMTPQINLSYIIKSLTYSRGLIDSLITFCRKYIKQQNTENQQLQIELSSRATNYRLAVQVQSSIVKRDFKMFVLQVLGQILKRKIVGFEKEICQFCVYVSKDQEEDVYSMSMILSLLLLSNNSEHSGWINRVIMNLLQKSSEVSQNIFNFIVIMWQRYPQTITSQILSILLQKQHFILHITEHQQEYSLSLPFFSLFEYLLMPYVLVQHKGTILQILRVICLKVKQQQFVRIHQTAYWSRIFFKLHQQIDSFDKKVRVSTAKLIGQLLAYQYAAFVESKNIAPIDKILSKQQVDKNGKIIWVNVKKAQQEKVQQQPIEQQKAASSSQQQPEQQQVAPKSQSSLLILIQSQLKSVITKINLSQAVQKQAAITLLNNYYNSGSQYQSRLSMEQKNKLFEDDSLFNEQYNVDRFYFDIQKRDYVTAIKFVIKDGNIEMCVKVLQILVQDKQAAGDILYRQLCRQAIQKLSDLAQNHYKSVMNSLNKLFALYCKNTQPELLKPINQTALKISSTIFSANKCGIQRGKYYKLISYHARLLCSLVVSPIYGQHYALQTYRKLIQIFGQENGYCFFIGVAEILAVKISKNKNFADFIDKVLIPSLKTNISESDSQGQFGRLNGLLRMVNKCVILCHHMLEDNIQKSNKQDVSNNKMANQNDQKENIHGLQSGVAKKMILNFFGITNPKNKRAIIRKIFMFLGSIFKNHKISQIYKQLLTTISRKQELKLCGTISKIYNLLIIANHNTKGPLQQSIEMTKTNLLKLLPLQLKIDVLGPLLPLNEVYEQLSTDLSHSSISKFQSLQYLVDIIPNQLCQSWQQFTDQCLSRSYIPSLQSITSILKMYNPQSSSQTQATNTWLIKFICSLAHHAKQSVLPVLDKVMEILIKQTENQANASYTLAIFYTFVQHMGDLVGPHMQNIFQKCIQIDDKNVSKFIDVIVQKFMPPSLILLTKTNYKTVNNSTNFTYFLLKISQILPYQQIYRTCQSYFARSVTPLINSHTSFSQLQQKQAQVFVTQIMKMNDSQLRKIIIEYVRWAAERSQPDQAAGFLFNSRKRLLYTVYEKVSKKIGELFNHFYGYVFEDIVRDLQTLKIMQQTKVSNNQKQSQKRDRQISQYSLQFTYQYTAQILHTLQSLFINDKQSQFLDSIKFDTIAPHLTSIFSMTKFQNYYPKLIQHALQPCLLALFSSTKDDYKLKTVNTEILRILRTKNQNIMAAVYAFYDVAVAKLDYRFLIFVDQIVPLLVEASSSRNQRVKKSVESIIYQVQNISGQKITQTSINANR